MAPIAISRESRSLSTDSQQTCKILFLFHPIQTLLNRLSPSSDSTLDSLLIDAITTMLAAELSVTLCTDSTLTNLLYQEMEVKIQKARLQEQAGEKDIMPEMHDLASEFKSNSHEDISPIVR